MELSLLQVTEQEVVMPYLVRAEIENPGRGTFKTEAETKRDAVEKAQRLRTQGFRAYVTDAKGAPVDETAELGIPVGNALAVLKQCQLQHLDPLAFWVSLERLVERSLEFLRRLARLTGDRLADVRRWDTTSLAPSRSLDIARQSLCTGAR